MLIRIPLFILAALFCYTFLLFLSKKYIEPKSRPNLYVYSSHSNVRFQEIKTVSDLDILFIGSSHSFRGFDTRRYFDKGYNVFNLGTRSQAPLQTEFLLKRYLKTTNPKLVVIEVFPYLLTIDGIEASLDVINNDYVSNDSYGLLLKEKNIKLLNSLLYNTANNFLFGEKFLKKVPLGKVYHYHKGGFISRDMSYYKYEKDLDKTMLEFKDIQLQSLNEIVNLLNRKNIDYIFVQAPIASARYGSIENNNEFDSIMTSKGKYINFNELVKLDDSLHFYDSHHLNQDGVDIFNDKFIELVLDEKGK